MNELLITFTPDFKRDYKRLAKKYASLDSDMKELVEELKENPTLGTPLGNDAFKKSWQFLLKIRENQVGQELSLISLRKIMNCICYLSMINMTKKV